MSRILRVGGVVITLLVVCSRAGWTDQHAQWPKTALETMRRAAIQHNGRNKPFDSFARETLQLITGKPHVAQEDPVATVLAILAEPDHWQQVPLISVPFVPLRDALGVDRKTTHVSYNDLVATRKLMWMLPAIVQKQQHDEKLSMLDNETMDAFQRFVALSGVLEQKLALVPPSSVSEREWLPILQPQGYPPKQQEAIHEAWTQLVSALRAGNAQTLQVSSKHLSEVLREANRAAYPPTCRLDLEVFYNTVAPFHIARAFYLLAFLGLLFSFLMSVRWSSRVGLGALWAGYASHVAGILMRVVLGGRPPVSNFFETMLWLPFVAMTLALMFDRVYRVRYFGLAASLLAAITLFLTDYVPLDQSIAPVVAVLHSNLWLTIHVLTIVASYGALALATMLAHVYGVLYLRPRGARDTLVSLDGFLYRVLQVGVVLLAGGVMLGAVWANASWGRYWGWDPKETWALITLLWFLAVLHGRFAGWLTGIGVALSTISGFFLLLMTYYGVSFYLVGLHSYAGGHAKPLPLLLIAYLMAECAFLAVVGAVALRRNRAASV